LPAQTRCERCGTVGFVRREHVIEKGKSLMHYYCGHCNQSWDVVEADRDVPAVADDRDEGPDKSR